MTGAIAEVIVLRLCAVAAVVALFPLCLWIVTLACHAPRRSFAHYLARLLEWINDDITVAPGQCVRVRKRDIELMINTDVHLVHEQSRYELQYIPPDEEPRSYGV